MKIITCVDDHMGMLFNQRRQSQDCVLRENLLELVGENRLRMNAYSAKQFDEAVNERLLISDNFLEEATQEDYCFVETIAIEDYEEQIQELILYHWNRSYPSDLKFNLTLDENWELIHTIEFKGNSHDLIRREPYQHIITEDKYE